MVLKSFPHFNILTFNATLPQLTFSHGQPCLQSVQKQLFSRGSGRVVDDLRGVSDADVDERRLAGNPQQAPSVFSKNLRSSQIIANHRRSSEIIGRRWGYLGHFGLIR